MPRVRFVRTGETRFFQSSFGEGHVEFHAPSRRVFPRRCDERSSKRSSFDEKVGCG